MGEGSLDYGGDETERARPQAELDVSDSFFDRIFVFNFVAKDG